ISQILLASLIVKVSPVPDCILRYNVLLSMPILAATSATDIPFSTIFPRSLLTLIMSLLLSVFSYCRTACDPRLVDYTLTHLASQDHFCTPRKFFLAQRYIMVAFVQH